MFSKFSLSWIVFDLLIISAKQKKNKIEGTSVLYIGKKWYSHIWNIIKQV